MTTSIYDQHRAAFANVSAYVVLKDGERVATVAFKYPKDGAGRLFAYVHWFGLPMTCGFAAGGGYDKHSAAVASAVSKTVWAAQDDNALHFARELAKDDGRYWNSRLEAVGFRVVQAV